MKALRIMGIFSALVGIVALVGMVMSEPTRSEEPPNTTLKAIQEQAELARSVVMSEHPWSTKPWLDVYFSAPAILHEHCGALAGEIVPADIRDPEACIAALVRVLLGTWMHTVTLP